jgi:type IV pilus assembly protein PilA
MKKNSKGFTLIELLVVVAIIGILAAVGVVAYNGYTASAKKNAVKTMHAQTLKYVSAEVQKCTLEGSNGKAFGSSSANCGQINGNSGATKAVTDLVNNSTDKNPYDNKEPAIKNSTAYVEGQVSVSGSGKVITIKSCYVTACSGDNISGVSTVTIE